MISKERVYLCLKMQQDFEKSLAVSVKYKYVITDFNSNIEI